MTRSAGINPVDRFFMKFFLIDLAFGLNNLRYMGGQNDDNNANDDDMRIKQQKHEIHVSFAGFFPQISEGVITCQWIIHEKVQNKFPD